MNKKINELQSVPMTEKSLNDMTWNIADQQFLVRTLDQRDNNLLYEISLKLKENQNETLSNVAEIIDTQDQRMLGFFGSVGKFMESIANDLNSIKGSIREINTKLAAMNKRQNSLEKRLEKVENTLAKHLECHENY